MERLTIRYIDELNAFDAWLETNEISTAAVALWYALMQIANKTGWKKTFNATNGILSVKTGGLSVPALHRARTALQSAGRISFRTRKGKQATEYTIIPFTSSVAYRIVKQTDQVTDQRTVHIPRLEKTRQDKKEKVRVRTNKNRPEKNRTDLAAVMQAYAGNIHPVARDIEKDKLLDMVESYGRDACLKAIERAVLRNRRSLAYIQGILRNWQANGYDETDNAREQTAENTSQYDAIPF